MPTRLCCGQDLWAIILMIDELHRIIPAKLLFCMRRRGLDWRRRGRFDVSRIGCDFAIGGIVDLAGGAAWADVPWQFKQITAVYTGFLEPRMTIGAGLPIMLSTLSAAGAAGFFFDFLQQRFLFQRPFVGFGEAFAGAQQDINE